MLLDQLALLVTEAAEEDARALVAQATSELERLAGVGLGPSGEDALVVLTRRFARAHGRLLARPGGPAGAEVALLALLDAVHAAQAGRPAAVPEWLDPVEAAAVEVPAVVAPVGSGGAGVSR